MNRRKRIKRRAAAFTLLEVLLVLVILVVLGSMAAVGVMGTQDKALKDSARAQVKIFDRAIELYRFNMKKYPGELEDLVNKPSDAKEAEKWGTEGYLNKKSIPLDPWDQEYRYESKDSSYRIWSVGPDGSDGTDDDIASDDEA